MALAPHIIMYMVKATMVVILPLTPIFLRVTIQLLSIVYMDTHIMGTLPYLDNVENNSKNESLKTKTLLI